MILYLLALGSPTHPIEPRAWDAWTATYRWDASDGFPRVAFDPLFGHQYSHVWVDFRGIQDPYMRSKGIDYFVNSTRATYANRAYCIANPAKWRRLRRIRVGPDRIGWAVEDRLRLGSQPCRQPVPRLLGAWRRARRHAMTGPSRSRRSGGSVPFAPELAIPTLLRVSCALRGAPLREVRFQGCVQSLLRRGPDRQARLVRRSVRRDRSGADSPDDRELPHRSDLDAHQEQPVPPRGPDPGQLHRRLARRRGPGTDTDAEAAREPAGTLITVPAQERAGDAASSSAYGSMITDTGAPWTESGAIRTSSVAGSTTCFHLQCSRTRALPWRG